MDRLHSVRMLCAYLLLLSDSVYDAVPKYSWENTCIILLRRLVRMSPLCLCLTSHLFDCKFRSRILAENLVSWNSFSTYQGPVIFISRSIFLRLRLF